MITQKIISKMTEKKFEEMMEAIPETLQLIEMIETCTEFNSVPEIITVLSGMNKEDRTKFVSAALQTTNQSPSSKELLNALMTLKNRSSAIWEVVRDLPHLNQNKNFLNELQEVLFQKISDPELQSKFAKAFVKIYQESPRSVEDEDFFEDFFADLRVASQEHFFTIFNQIKECVGEEDSYYDTLISFVENQGSQLSENLLELKKYQSKAREKNKKVGDLQTFLKLTERIPGKQAANSYLRKKAFKLLTQHDPKERKCIFALASTFYPEAKGNEFFDIIQSFCEVIKNGESGKFEKLAEFWTTFREKTAGFKKAWFSNMHGYYSNSIDILNVIEKLSEISLSPEKYENLFDSYFTFLSLVPEKDRMQQEPELIDYLNLFKGKILSIKINLPQALFLRNPKFLNILKSLPENSAKEFFHVYDVLGNDQNSLTLTQALFDNFNSLNKEEKIKYCEILNVISPSTRFLKTFTSPEAARNVLNASLSIQDFKKLLEYEDQLPPSSSSILISILLLWKKINLNESPEIFQMLGVALLNSSLNTVENVLENWNSLKKEQKAEIMQFTQSLEGLEREGLKKSQLTRVIAFHLAGPVSRGCGKGAQFWINKIIDMQRLMQQVMYGFELAFTLFGEITEKEEFEKFTTDFLRLSLSHLVILMKYLSGSDVFMVKKHPVLFRNAVTLIATMQRENKPIFLDEILTMLQSKYEQALTQIQKVLSQKIPAPLNEKIALQLNLNLQEPPQEIVLRAELLSQTLSKYPPQEQNEACAHLISIYNQVPTNRLLTLSVFLEFGIQPSMQLAALKALKMNVVKKGVQHTIFICESWGKIKKDLKEELLAELNKHFSKGEDVWEMAFSVCKEGNSVEEIEQQIEKLISSVKKTPNNMSPKEANVLMNYLDRMDLLEPEDRELIIKTIGASNEQDVDFLNIFNQLFKEIPDDELGYIFTELKNVPKIHFKELFAHVLSLRNDPQHSGQVIELTKALQRLPTEGARNEVCVFINKELGKIKGYLLVSIVKGLATVPRNAFSTVLSKLNGIVGWQKIQIINDLLKVLAPYQKVGGEIYLAKLEQFIRLGDEEHEGDIRDVISDFRTWESLTLVQQNYASEVMSHFYRKKLQDVLLFIAYKPKSQEEWISYINDLKTVFYQKYASELVWIWIDFFKETTTEQRIKVMESLKLFSGKEKMLTTVVKLPLYHDLINKQEKLEVLHQAMLWASKMLKINFRGDSKRIEKFIESNLPLLLEQRSGKHRVEYLEQLTLLVPALHEVDREFLLRFETMIDLMPIDLRSQSLGKIFTKLKSLPNAGDVSLYLKVLSDVKPENRLQFLDEEINPRTIGAIPSLSRLIAPDCRNAEASSFGVDLAADADMQENARKIFGNKPINDKSVNYILRKLLYTNTPQYPSADHAFAKAVLSLFNQINFGAAAEKVNEKAQAMMQISNAEDCRVATNPYYLFHALKTSLRWDSDFLKLERIISLESGQKAHVEFHLEKLRRKASEKRLTFADLSKDYASQNFLALIQNFYTRISNFSKSDRDNLQKLLWRNLIGTDDKEKVIAEAVEEIQKSNKGDLQKVDAIRKAKAKIEHFFSSTTIQNLIAILQSNYFTDLTLKKGKPTDPIENTKVYVHKVLDWIYDQEDKLTDSLFTPREEAFLRFSAQVKECPTGQKDGLTLFYMMNLSSEYKNKDLQPEIEKGLVVGASEMVEACIDQINLQSILEETFTKTSLLSDLADIRNSNKTSEQESHETEFLYNLVGPHFGINRGLAFDRSSGQVPKEIRDRPIQHVINKVLEYFPLTDTIAKLKKAVKETTEKFADSAEAKYITRKKEEIGFSVENPIVQKTIQEEREKGRQQFYNALKDYLADHVSQEEKDYDPHWEKRYLKMSIKYNDGLLVENKFLGEITDEGALALLQVVGIISDWSMD